MVDFSRDLYYIDGIEMPGDTLVVTCGPTDEPGAMRSVVLFRIGGTWSRYQLSGDSIVSLARLGPSCFALGENGAVLAFGQPGSTAVDARAVQSPAIVSLPTSVTMTRLRRIGNHLLAAGWSGQLHQYDGQWKPLAVTILESDEFEIQDLCGSSIGDFYLVGMGGRIVHYDGSWREVASPTNSHLSTACMDPTGLVYASGDGGILLRGIGDRWDIVTELNSGLSIWSIAYFAGQVYGATSSDLFVLRNDDWQQVRLLSDITPPFNRLCAGQDKLWSIGELAVACFDGVRWATVGVPNS